MVEIIAYFEHAPCLKIRTDKNFKQDYEITQFLLAWEVLSITVIPTATTELLNQQKKFSW